MCKRGHERLSAAGARLCALLLCYGLALLARPQEWVKQQYTSDNGLPQNSVCSMVMDQEGYIWIITEGGLVRYDGYTTQRIPLPSGGATQQRLREIVPVGNDSFALRDSGSRKLILYKGHLYPLGPQDLEEDGYPYCRGSAPTLAGYNMMTRLNWPIDPSGSWTAERMIMLTIRDHDWVVTTPGGLLHLRDTTVVGLTRYRSDHDRFFAIGEGIYAMRSDEQIYRVDLRTHEPRPVALIGLPVPATPHRPLLESFWRTNDHVACVRCGTDLYTLVPTATGDTLFAAPMHLDIPVELDISSLYVDPERGVVLVGSSTQGLFVYRKARLHTLLRSRTSFGNANVYYAQAVIGDDRVMSMSGTQAQGFTVAGADSAPLPFTRFNMQGIYTAPDGNIWYGSDSLVCHYDPATGSSHCISTIPGSAVRVLCLWKEADSVWVGMDKGIGYVKNDRFTLTYVSAGSSHNNIPFMIRRGPDGALWFGTCSGAFRLDRSARKATVVHGLEDKCVRAFQVMEKRMYIGTYGTGAWVFENDSLHHLPGDRMGFLDHVHCFMPDSLGFLWLSTNHGLFRVRQREIDAYLNGTSSTIYYAYYGRSAGILNTEFNGGCDPPYVRLRNGYASFPSLEGLVWFKPEAIPDPYPSSPIRIDEVLINGVPCGDSTAISLRPEHHELIVRFSMAYWGDAANAQFMYRLDGVQDEWYPIPTDQRELRFQHLPYGEHVLTIRKLGAPPGDRSDRVELHFTVRRPYYLSAWFLLLCAGGVALLYVLGFHLYRARLRRKNILLGRMVRSRTIELRGINQRLERSVAVKERLVSIISHDIVTPLRFIARVAHRAESAGPDTPEQELVGTLHDIALSSDKLYMNARNLLDWIKHQGGHIELRPAHVALAALVDDTLGPVRDLASSKDRVLVNAVPLDDILRTDRDLLGIILQNLVNNALGHGQGGRVTITGEQRAENYHLTVADEGPGLPPRTLEAIEQLQRNGRHGRGRGSDVLGLGYVIITELLQLLGGHLTITDNFGRGTRITIVLPPLTAVEEHDPASPLSLMDRA